MPPSASQLSNTWDHGVTLARPAEPHAGNSPLLYVTTAVLMLSTVTPVMKSLLRQSDIPALDLVCLRVFLAFICLVAVTLAGPWQELLRVSKGDVVRLTLLGILGVGIAYGLAGWALVYTNVSHYSVIYSLHPTLTALLSLVLRKDRVSTLKLAGIALSLCGCLFALPDWLFDQDVGFGDLLVLLFTLSAAACVVLSSGMVKRYGAAATTTVMFGTGLVFLLPGAMIWSLPSHVQVSLTNGLLIVYVGVATAAVFLLRNLSLQFLTPATVGAFHNLVPVFGILIAASFLGEPITANMVVGGTAVLAGVELVRRG
ncbi:MAG: DMT family transporter [Nitrospirota bacterium]|nr:DMT family transporter [Nitrospirota bacterium]MDE3244063.1 DMT family transporter [Nitrospirota bacterium]